jgi:prolyl-tRNA synthetase
MLNVYATFAEKFMALPVIKGVKTESERFPGAVDTYCIEALMQDGKALQSGTSHFLGQNFANAFDVKFADKNGKLEYVWGTSWGVSTRLMGALIMAHSDDDGLILPPSLAPIQVVAVPIFKQPEQLEAIRGKINVIRDAFLSRGISFKFDDRDTQTPGWKFAEYELKGVPVRLAMGPRDMENGTIEVARRDIRDKKTVPLDQVVDHVVALLDDIQANIYKRALAFREENTHFVDNYEEFKNLLDEKGGFIWAHWDGTPETEEKIKEETKATIRCIPIDTDQPEGGKCMYSGKPSKQRVLFARAY